MGTLHQVEVAVVVDVAKQNIGAGFVCSRILIEATVVGDDIRAADVDEESVLEPLGAGLKDEQSGSGNAFEGVGRIVGADGDVDVPVLVDVAQARLAVVGEGVTVAVDVGA